MEYGSLSFLERVHTGAASGTQGKVGDGESRRWPGVCLVAFGRVAKGQQDGTPLSTLSSEQRPRKRRCDEDVPLGHLDTGRGRQECADTGGRCSQAGKRGSRWLTQGDGVADQCACAKTGRLN